MNPMWIVFFAVFGVCVGAAPDWLLPISSTARYVIGGAVPIVLFLLINLFRANAKPTLGVRRPIRRR